ncbi:hypothetical protein Lal_00045398 [Lupinus albus]|nr:hypothetical protein Lal_00045398 [Lupinus albus]
MGDPKLTGPGPENPLVPEFGPTPCCCCCSSKNADVSSVGRHPAPNGNLTPPADPPFSLFGSGFSTGAIFLISDPEYPAPVTCCTICRKSAGSVVMNVVCDRFDARDFRFEIFPVAPTARRLGADSWSEPPEIPETVEVVGAGTLTSWLKGLRKGERETASFPEIDFEAL